MIPFKWRDCSVGIKILVDKQKKKNVQWKKKKKKMMEDSVFLFFM